MVGRGERESESEKGFCLRKLSERNRVMKIGCFLVLTRTGQLNSRLPRVLYHLSFRDDNTGWAVLGRAIQVSTQIFFGPVQIVFLLITNFWAGPDYFIYEGPWFIW